MCAHPPTRLYAWTAYDETLCIGCCDCGAVLQGASDDKEKPIMDTTKSLQAVAEHMATECFTPEYVQNHPQENREIEGLGIALVRWSQWDGLKLMHVFMEALTDANFHTEAGQVQDMITRVMED
jgi:hypothetical protein